jgi:hypothetical protein
MGYKTARALSIIVAAGSLVGCVDPVGLVFNTDEVLAYHLGQSQPASAQNGLSTAFNGMSCDSLQQTIKAYETPYYSTPEGAAARQQATLIYTQRGCSASETDTAQKHAESNNAAVAPPTPASPAVLKVIALPVKSKSTLSYCYAYLTVGEERGSTCSPVVEINDSDRTGSVFQVRLNSYVEKVKQSQPGVWGDFEYADTMKMHNAFIYQMKPKANAVASKQDAGLICYESRADADAQLAQSKKNDSSMKVIAWP